MDDRTDNFGAAHAFLARMWAALGGDAGAAENVRFDARGNLPSVFGVTDLASAAMGAAAVAIAELTRTSLGSNATVVVDRRLASLWYGWSLRPRGWTLPQAWDAVAGDYPTTDGWIRLHTNAPHHRAAALGVLGAPAERTKVEDAVRTWAAEDLEAAIVANSGCAAAMRSVAEWAEHPQGRAIRAEPLVTVESTPETDVDPWQPSERTLPLAGLRVLDLTRVLAGPVATRFLAGFGADVLRIDPPGWDEPVLEPDMTLGKRCARLDLRNAADRRVFEDLLRRAHVLVHGYRADALEGLGLGRDVRRAIRPGLVDVCVDAYGWSGPWRNRRGFDSLVQMSAGIAQAGMVRAGRDRPVPLPVQALDHATGYLMAAAVVCGLQRRLATGTGFEARTALARTGALLVEGGTVAPGEFVPAADADFSAEIEQTANGPAHRLRPPVSISGTTMRWDRPATKLGTSPAAW